MQKIQVDSYDSFPLEKTVTLRNVTILIILVFNKDKNNYYYSIFLEKGLYQLPKNNDNKYIMIELTFLKESILIRQDINLTLLVLFT